MGEELGGKKVDGAHCGGLTELRRHRSKISSPSLCNAGLKYNLSSYCAGRWQQRGINRWNGKAACSGARQREGSGFVWSKLRLPSRQSGRALLRTTQPRPMEPTELPVASTSTLPPHESEPEPVSFEDLGIEPFLVRALRVMSIRKPTSVQAACIPAILSGQSEGGAASRERGAGGRRKER